MHSPTTRGEFDNGMYKPMTEGMSGSRQHTPDLTTVQSAGSDELMWLLLERMLDFSMQCRQTQTMYARGNYNPVLQELLSLLRMNGGGAFGNTSFGGGGYNNSFLVDKISYLITKLDQQEQHVMNQNAPQLPSTGPVLEILFQMLRNQNTPSAPKNQQEYPELVQKHLKVLGDLMMQLDNLPSEGRTLDLLLTLADKELQSDTGVMNVVVDKKDSRFEWTKNAFRFVVQHISANRSSSSSSSVNNGSGGLIVESNNGEEKDLGIDKWEKAHNENILHKVNRHFRNCMGHIDVDGYTSQKKQHSLKTALREIKTAEYLLGFMFDNGQNKQALQSKCLNYKRLIESQLRDLGGKGGGKGGSFLGIKI